jgi:hypothetical protein
MVSKSILLLDWFVLLPAQSCHSDDMKIFHLSQDSTIYLFIDVFGAFLPSHLLLISDVLEAIFSFLSSINRVEPTTVFLLPTSSGSLRVQHFFLRTPFQLNSTNRINMGSHPPHQLLGCGLSWKSLFIVSGLVFER